MTRRFTLTPLTITGAVLFLAAGELASGTGLAFVAMMVIAMLAICITYNMLGGLSTISGVVFASSALYMLAISQVAKVFMFEAADLTLQSPDLTMSVYAVYFVSLMAGVFLFGRIRVALPKPLEPSTARQSGIVYVISLVLGSVAQFLTIDLVLENPNQSGSITHGMARAFSALLPLALVVAVDSRIRKTDGRSCFGWMALWPAAAIELAGFATGTRTGYVLPPLLVAVTCYFRGYKFRARHYLAAGALAVVLFSWVSPWELWARAWRNQSSVPAQIAMFAKLASEAPAHWRDILDSVRAQVEASRAFGLEYFRRAGTVTLDRLVLIPDDDAVINACRHHHWGFATIKIDAQYGIPHFVEPNKPDRDGTWYRASVGGLQSSYQPTSYITTSTIADAWGGFGWAGVIVVPLLLVPWLFVEFDSMFDITRPWGTVAAVTLSVQFAVAGVGGLLTSYLFEIPIYILLVSWFIGWIVRTIPMTGDNPRRRGVPLFSQEKIRTIAGD